MPIIGIDPWGWDAAADNLALLLAARTISAQMDAALPGICEMVDGAPTDMCQCAQPDAVVNDTTGAAWCAICGGNIPAEFSKSILENITDARREAKYQKGL